ncbi:hypothetical protein MRX96_023408 [Rhipicephalus microplus]
MGPSRCRLDHGSVDLKPVSGLSRSAPVQRAQPSIHSRLPGYCIFVVTLTLFASMAAAAVLLLLLPRPAQSSVVPRPPRGSAGTLGFTARAQNANFVEDGARVFLCSFSSPYLDALLCQRSPDGIFNAVTANGIRALRRTFSFELWGKIVHFFA